MNTRNLTALICSLVLALPLFILTSCAPTTDENATPESVVPRADIPVRGGTLRTEHHWMPYMPDPATDGVGTGLVGLSIAESLVWVGKDFVARPQLIKSWEVSEDAMEWTLHLQEGVTFNNGKPFGADDVIWNFNHCL